MSLSKLQEMVKDSEAWHAAVHGLQQSMGCKESDTTEQLNSKQLIPNSQGVKNELMKQLMNLKLFPWIC